MANARFELTEVGREALAKEPSIIDRLTALSRALAELSPLACRYYANGKHAVVSEMVRELREELDEITGDVRAVLTPEESWRPCEACHGAGRHICAKDEVCYGE